MNNYEKLREILEKHPSGAPPSKAFDEIMRILFTPEEVEAALGMNFAPRRSARIAEECGLSEPEVRKYCESMAAKGIVFSGRGEGDTVYALLPTIPGLFEFPFMKGGGTPMHERLGKLWEEYHQEGMGLEFGGSDTALARVIPVEQTVRSQPEVLPFEVISEMLEKSKTFALAHCACRVSVGKCDQPREVCMILDRAGQFLIERGLAREISRDEAAAVIRQADEAGLVHTTNNSQDRLNFICNCCPCCCTILRGLTELENPRAFARSGWRAEGDPELCTACCVCEEDRCPVGAIKVGERVAEVDPGRCIGCGLCATTCESGAITMLRRDDAAKTPATVAEMGLKVATEKGRVGEFLELMKK